jgi:hypothetical protein
LFSFQYAKVKHVQRPRGLTFWVGFTFVNALTNRQDPVLYRKHFKKATAGRECSSYLALIAWSLVHSGILWRRDVNQERHHIQTAFSPQKLKALDVYAIGKQRGFKLFFEEGFWNVFAARFLRLWRHAKWMALK